MMEPGKVLELAPASSGLARFDSAGGPRLRRSLVKFPAGGKELEEVAGAAGGTHADGNDCWSDGLTEFALADLFGVDAELLTCEVVPKFGLTTTLDLELGAVSHSPCNFGLK
jgi:hypothetical protein